MITTITDSIISVDLCKKHKINFIADNVTFKFENFSKRKMDLLYLTESIQTDKLNMLYEYYNEGDTP